MKSKNTLFNTLLLAGSSLLAVSTASAQSTHTWANSNITATPPSDLDWFTGGSNPQGTWTGGDPVSSNLNTIQFFQDATTSLVNTGNPNTQNVILNNGGSAFELGTLILSGRASITSNAKLIMNFSGDAFNFSGATSTIGLDATNVDTNRTITYNVANNIQLGTASSGSVLTLAGNGTSAFNFSGIISELQAGGGSLVKSGTSAVTLTGTNSYSGTTAINAGTLTISGSSGSISGSTGVTLAKGTTLSLDNSSAIVDRIGDTASLTLNGGTLVFTGRGSSGSATETIDTLAIGAGGSTITLTGAGAGQLQTLAASDFSRAGNGTALIRGTSLQTGATNATRFALADSLGLTLVGGGTANLGTSTAGTNTTLSIAPYLMGDTSTTGAGSSFLTYDESGAIRPLAAGEYTTLSAGYTTPVTPENVNAFNGTITTASDITVNSLRFNGTLALNGSGGALIVNSGAIALTTNNAASIGSGFSGLTLGNGTWNEGIIHVSQNTLTINTAITVTGGGGLTKAGAATLNLAATNNYTGNTAINAGTLTFSAAQTNTNIVTAGSGIFTQSGSGTIGGTGVTFTQGSTGTSTLSLANSYTGGTFINSGILLVSADTQLGAGSAGITFDGGQLTVSGNLATARDFTVGSAGGALRVAKNNNITTTGNLTGSGTLNLIDNGGSGTLSTYNFNSTANTFTGGIVINNSILGLNSLADSANSIVFNGGGALNYGSAAIAPLAFVSRGIELNSSAASTATIQNNNTAYAITIGGDVVATGAGAKTLALGAVASPATNIFSGDISDGTGGGSVAVTKTGAGTWVLSGTNTYTGKTFNNSGNGTLIFQDVENSLSSASALTTAINSNQNQINRLLSDTSGTINLGNTVRTDGGGSSGTGTMTLFVGNNNVVNGGSSSGTTSGSKIVLGTLDLRSSAEGGLVDGRMASRIAITGANDYKLEIGDVIMQARGTSSSTGAYFIPTTAPLIIAGTVKQNNGRTAADNVGLQTLTLDGTATANEIKGAIKNATDFDDTSNANALATSLTKSNLSTWTLSGANTYSGGTTITTGKLVFSGANSLPTTGTIAVGANGHLSIADGVARAQTVSTLTLANGSSLSFDWTGSGTGDQLTSTADITPSAGSRFAVNLNRSGTPGGPLTLLTGGASSTLNGSTFYLANLTDFTATLSTPTADTLVVDNYAAQTALTTMYWMGNKLAAGAVAGVDNAWALSNGTVSNWSTTNGTYAATALTPGATANVIFSNTLTGRAQQSTVLGSDVTVNSLVIADGTAVTIAGANGAALTLMSNLSTAGLVDGTPGSAITVTSTANATSTISANVNLGSNQTWNVASGKTLTVSGLVSGGFSLAKADAGTVILSAAGSEDIGDITINAGTLRIGSNTATTLNNGNYAGNIVNNGLLQIWSTANQTFSGVISGSGNLQKAYGGTLTLAGNNTYTGQTLLQPQTTAGFTLFVSSFNSVFTNPTLGTVHSASSSLGAPTTVENGTIQLGSTGAQTGVNITYTGSGETTDRVINFAMNGTGATKTLDASGTGLLKFTSTFTKTAGSSNNNDVALQGAGNGEIVGGLDFVFRNFTKAGTGTWTLGANLGHTGTTTISGGTMELNSGATIGGGTYSNTITFSNSSTLKYNSTANQTLGGVISGAGSLVKDNTGTLTLTNANTYTSGTTVSEGTLLVNNTTGSGTGTGAVTIAAGATLGGSGTITGITTISGIHSPGNSPDILNHGDLVYTSASSVTWELVANAIGTRGDDFDGINVSGTLDFQGATTMDLVFNFTGSTVNWTDAFWDNSYIGTSGWQVYDVAGTTANFGNLSVTAANWFDGSGDAFNDFRSGNTFSLFQDGDDIYLNYSAIPEPSVALLGGLGALLMFRRRRA